MSSVPCPVQQACGGCPLMPLSIEAQRARKLGLIEAAGTANALGALPWRDAPFVQRRPLGYRRRLRMRVEKGRVQFFNPHKVLACAVVTPGVKRGIDRLAGALAGLPLSTHLEIREPDLDLRPGLYLGAGEPTLVRVLQSRLGPSWAIGTSASPRKPRQRYALDDELWGYVPVDGFLQIHEEVSRALRHEMLAFVQPEDHSFVDLFAGSGALSLPLAKRGLEGTAVEIQADAVAAADESAAAQGLTLSTFASPIGDALDSLSSASIVLLNPPRAGVRADLRRVADLAQRAIIMVYCRADSWARDARILVEEGFTITSVQAFDMFPHTAHVEVLALLERNS
ncbi:MAG: methyltransferase [Myxococcota bacterium]